MWCSGPSATSCTSSAAPWASCWCPWSCWGPSCARRTPSPPRSAAGGWASFIDCAPYIDDARVRRLLLTSGETGQEDWEGHDWYQLLSRTGHLKDDHLLARWFWIVGALLLLAALAWGAYVLWRQWGRPVEKA